MQQGANPFYGTCGSGISFSTWQGSCGFDTHGKNIAVTVNSDYTLPTGSTVIKAPGTTPANMPTAYLAGRHRPSAQVARAGPDAFRVLKTGRRTREPLPARRWKRRAKSPFRSDGGRSIANQHGRALRLV